MIIHETLIEIPRNNQCGLGKISFHLEPIRFLHRRGLGECLITATHFRPRVGIPGQYSSTENQLTERRLDVLRKKSGCYSEGETMSYFEILGRFTRPEAKISNRALSLALYAVVELRQPATARGKKLEFICSECSNSESVLY